MAFNINVKTAEECSELVKEIMKMEMLEICDGGMWADMEEAKSRTEDEVADVYACLDMLVEKHKLDYDAILDRQRIKLAKYREWDNQA